MRTARKYYISYGSTPAPSYPSLLEEILHHLTVSAAIILEFGGILFSWQVTTKYSIFLYGDGHSQRVYIYETRRVVVSLVEAKTGLHPPTCSCHSTVGLRALLLCTYCSILKAGVSILNCTLKTRQNWWDFQNGKSAIISRPLNSWQRTSCFYSIKNKIAVVTVTLIV